MDSVDQIQQIIEQMTNGVEAADVKAISDSLHSLESGYAGKQQFVTVIKMMQSLTKYLNSRKDKVHPETLPALGTLSGNLKSLLMSQTAEDQAQILLRSKRTFKSLKSAIESGKLILDSEMEELKAVILSVDWEISSITMKGFDRVVSRLEQRLKFHKMHYTFLRIMHQIGAHIAKRKADAHQDSVSLLRWVFQQYELLVAHPDMAPDKKKQLVQANIQAYKVFQRKIEAGLSPDLSPEDHAALPARTIQSSAQGQSAAPDSNGDNSEGDGFAPALSHIGKKASDLEDGQFFALDDPMTDPALDLESTKGTPSKGKDAFVPQRDVMTDLFSMKESPADELLDAIHLSGIHGPDQENAAAMPGVLGEAEKEAGTRQITPQRMDSTPIPEIERRLDAFFSLNTSDADVVDAQAPPASQALDHVETLGGESGFSKESVDFSGHIVPVPDMQGDDAHLQGEPGNDEAFPEISREDDTDDDMATREPAPDLDDLQNLLSDPDTLSSLDVFEQVQEKVANLNEIWASDSDKARLVDLVSSMARFIHQQALPDTEEDGLLKSPESNEGVNGMETAESNEIQKKDGDQKKKGFFARLKAKFKG